MTKLWLAFILATSLAGCDQTTKKIDETTFVKFGGTLFSSPNIVSMKEIHLDNGALLGRSIIIEGSVINIGSHSTHLILADDTARMLVVLSHLPTAEVLLNNKSIKRLKVLGTVERGKKGLPLVMATALAPLGPKAI